MIDNIKQPCESFILLSSIIHALRWINNIMRELEILHIPFKNVSYNKKRVFLFIQYSQLSQRRKLQIHFFLFQSNIPVIWSRKIVFWLNWSYSISMRTCRLSEIRRNIRMIGRMVRKRRNREAAGCECRWYF